MPSRTAVLRGLACLPVALTGAVHAAPIALPSGQIEQAFTFHHENVLGTSLQLTLLAGSPLMAGQAEAALLAAIDHHDALLSAWRAESEFSRWMTRRNVATLVSPELMEALSLFDQWRDRTGGALDAAVASAAGLWKRATDAGLQPTAGELAAVVTAMQHRHWRLDAAAGTATRLTDTPLVLASFTKSLIANRAVDAALGSGASGVMLNLGGDIIVRGNLTQLVHVADPRNDAEGAPAIDLIALNNRALATSGDYRRGFGMDASRRPAVSHIFDPRTAMPTSHIASSSVIARDPVTAGALATAFSVLTPQESVELASNTPGTEYLLVTREGERIASDGWNGLRLPSRHAALRAAPAKQTFELSIDVELAQIDNPRYRRPYLAVWIEDADHKAVKTVALWYDKARYLPDLTEWYRDDQDRVSAGGQSITSTVASATRQPGKYTIKWDGTDLDNKPLKQGKYTICLEVAREHGGRQIIRQPLDLNSTEQHYTAPAGAELGAVSFDYRKQ